MSIGKHDRAPAIGTLERQTNADPSAPPRTDRNQFYQSADQHVLNAAEWLAASRPELSAKTTFSKRQLIALFVLMCCALLLAVFSYGVALSIFLALCLLFYLATVLLRASVLAQYGKGDEYLSQDYLHATDTNLLPKYSVLVALYDEASQIAGLTTALSRINWPKDRLQILLICEAEDRATLDAIDACKLPPCFETVIVPDCAPRTKPKALNFALPLCEGAFVVLYDAEDRPHPDQLLEAWHRFSKGEPELSCLQAPLQIHNSQQSVLTRLFAIEYLTLFEGILPALGPLRIPMPLGGTSNHFKMSRLVEAGGWDPYNVTEDADLGIRLYRMGYRCETLSRPTYEEAPPHFRQWKTQRTRWLKGWMQTILVHTRHPLKLTQDLGLWPTIGFHLMLTSIVISSLLHPLFMLASVWSLASGFVDFTSSLNQAIIAASIFTLVGGYSTYCFLSYAVLRSFNQRALIPYLALIPFYWLLISLASWRALYQLISTPHLWEKTEHGFAEIDRSTSVASSSQLMDAG